ncbi:glycosyltransferase family A protein [Bauldia sp.]|uniref:glycosyltransferase family A protein n=1 Tax=Bauldia sp. TaxID=2575872 RepID=UPI003BAC19DC
MTNAGGSRLPDHRELQVDVLIPHFNDPDGLELSLKTVATQAWPGRFRVVIVDDGSSSDNRSAVETLLAEQAGDDTFVLVGNAENRGRPFTRNVLLDHIDSPYVAWLDAGDEWYPDKTRLQLERLRAIESGGSGDGAWITCNYDWQWVGRRPKPRRQSTKGDQVKLLLGGSRLRAYLWTLLGSAQSFEAIGRFDEKLPRLQDLDFFLRFVESGGVLHSPATKASLCKYNKSDVGRNADEVRACYGYIYEKHRKQYQSYGRHFVRHQLYKMEMHAARFAKNNNQVGKKRYYQWQAFRRWPRRFINEEILGSTK